MTTQNHNSVGALARNERLPKPCRTVLDYLEKVGTEKTPAQIAAATSLNRNSVCSYVRRLDRAGCIHRTRYGHYASASSIVRPATFGVSGHEVAPRIHNVMLRGRFGKRCSQKFSIDGIALVTIACYKNGTCSVYVKSSGEGMDYAGWRILEAWLNKEIQFEGEVRVVRYELNHDFEGLQLDGCSALTLKAFDGSIERIYNRKGGTLRSEVRARKGVDPASVYALLKGGITPYVLTQTSFMLVQEVRSLVEAVKFGNQQNLQILRLFQDYFRRLWGEEA